MNRKFLIFNWMDIKNPNAGGQEKYCYEIGRRLAKDGFRVIWIASRFQNSSPNENFEGMEIIRTGNIYTVFLTSIFKYLQHRKNSYVLLSMNSIPFIFPFSRKRRIIMLHHRIELKVMKEKAGILGHVSFFLQERINPLIFRNDKIITNSQSSKQDFESIGYKNVSIVRLGVDISDTANFTKKKICISPGPLKPWKHHEMVLIAFANMPAEWELSIFGSFESIAYKNKLLTICNYLKIMDRVHFLGRISDLELKEVYEQASICILGTEKEGWGFVAMEAQSFGCPVVAFNVPGIRDSVVNNETGMLVDFGNVDALSNALNVLATNNETLKRMSENAIRRSKEYSWEACYEEFRRELQKISSDI
jgi:glycosyltransferase involved in cell wall biosynthesis